MASVSISDEHLSLLHHESLPLIDLHHLAQSELYSLSLCSSTTKIDHRLDDDDDNDLLNPKIDRSVFNESAGSRKQTYSRLRLAPRNTNLKPAATTITVAPSISNHHLDAENALIVSALKKLFNASATNDDDPENLIPVDIGPPAPPDAAPESSFQAFQVVPLGGGVEEAREVINLGPISGGERKRKRGRPRKEESRVVGVVESGVKVEEKERENVAAVCDVEDPFGEELRRRTGGFQRLEEFIEYLDGVKGEWCSARKKRKVVDAGEFGDVLPVGWRLVLCLKKQAGRVWLVCSRYISPHGQQFASCKEVSLHFLPSFGFQGAAKIEPTSCTDETVDLSCKVNSGNAADLAQNGDKTSGDDLGFCSPLPAASTNHVRQDILPLATGGSDRAERGEAFNCHKCTMIYTKTDDLLHHLLTFHKGSAKRSKGNMSNDEVILKDGKYECQFCHKLFDEKHRYNGHLGVHIKSYVKRVEASVGAGTIQKTVQPGQAGLPTDDVSKKQGLAGNDERSVAGTSSASVNPHIGKEDAVNGTYTEDTHISEHNLMCKVDLTTTVGDTNKTLAVGSCYVEHDSCKITDYTMEKGNDSSDVISAKSNVGLAAHTDKMSNDVNDFSGGTDAQNCCTVEINCVVQEGSDNGSISLPGNEKIALKNANGSCISSIEEHEQGKCSGVGLVSPIVEGNTNGNISTDNMPFTSTTELMDVDDESKVGSDQIISGSGNNCTESEHISSKQQRSSGGSSPFPFGNDRSFDFLNDANGNSTSILAEPVQEKGSSSGLLTSFVDNQPFVPSNKNAFSDSTFDEVKINKINSSWNKELTIGMPAGQTTPGDGSITSSQVERNFSDCTIPRWDGPTCQVRNNTNANCRAQESWNEKSIATYLCPSGNDQTTGFHDDVYKHSGGTMNMFNLVDDRKNCEPFPYGSNDTKVGANSMTSTVQGSNSRVTFLSPSSSEQAYIFGNHGISNNNAPEHLKLDRGYGGVLNSPSGVQQISVGANNVKRVPSKTHRELEHENVRGHWNSGLPVALDGSHDGLNRNALFDGQTFALENNGTRIGSYTVEDHKQKRGPVSSFLCLSGGVQNNLNPMYDGMMQESNRFEDVRSMRHNSPMVGFGNHVQPNEDVMFELMRRTNGENAPRNGLAGTSSPMLQSSGSFPTFDMMSDKGGTNVNEKMDSMSAGFQGWRSDNMNMNMNMNTNTNTNTGHLEYSFMGAQDGSNSRDKMFSYGSQGGFDSPGWHHKEALPLLPKIANRYQVNSLCVWCRNEFLHETDESVTQMSSMGSMCPSCKAKFSGQLSLF